MATVDTAGYRSGLCGIIAAVVLLSCGGCCAVAGGGVCMVLVASVGIPRHARVVNVLIV